MFELSKLPVICHNRQVCDYQLLVDVHMLCFILYLKHDNCKFLKNRIASFDSV